MGEGPPRGRTTAGANPPRRELHGTDGHMPITPFQAFRLDKAEYEVLRFIEGKIDSHLEEHYFPGLTVNVSLPAKTVTDRILHSIMGRYQEAGWTIERKSSPGSEMIQLDFIPNRADLE